MIRRKEITKDILPAVPTKAHAFAYRPYTAAAVASGRYGRAIVNCPNYTASSALLPDTDEGGEGEYVRQRSSNRSTSTSTSTSKGGDLSPGVQIISRDDGSNTGAERLGGYDADRLRMAQLHAQAVRERVSQARRLVDDQRYEYACDAVFECQRGFNFLGKANFSAKLLHPMDPPPWCDATMKLTLANVHSYQLPDPSWQWVSPRWLIDMTLDVDEDGWQYSTRFSATKWRGQHSAAKSFVRRRRWVRLRRRLRLSAVAEIPADDYEDGCEQPIAEFNPNLHPLQKLVRSKPVSVASMLKNKVPTSHTSSSPKSPPKSSSKNLTYTLKNGRYTSHKLEKVDTYAKGIAVSQRTSAQNSPSLARQSRATSVVSSAAASGAVQRDMQSATPRPYRSQQPGLGSENVPGTPTLYTSLMRMPNKPPAAADRFLQQEGSGAAISSRASSESNSRAEMAPIPEKLRNAPTTWFDGEAALYTEHSSKSSTAHRRLRDALPLPTGGVALNSLSSVGMSASISDDAGIRGASEVSGYVEGVPAQHPKLTGLMAPERTVPLDDDSTAKQTNHWHSREPYDVTARSVNLSRPSTHVAADLGEIRKHPSLPVAHINTDLDHLQMYSASLTATMPSALPSAGAAGRHVPTKSTETQPSSLCDSVSVDDDADSTVVASHAALAEGRSPKLGGNEDEPCSPVATDVLVTGRPLRHRLSIASIELSVSPSLDSGSVCLSPYSPTSITSLDFQMGDFPPLDEYADPYMALQLPSDDSAAPVGTSIDKSLLQMTSATLKQMISQISLDRERLDFLRDGLCQGGITAATIWYTLPWLHYDLLRYDTARQRLIAMLLQFSHTCPLDALMFYTSAKRGCSAESLMRTLSERERGEYQALLDELGKDDSAVVMSPSQVWRFVVRPLVSCDHDLFYSDFKLMVVGVAKWSLTQGN